MLSRIEKYKTKHPFKKVLIIIGALFLSVSVGSGVKTALADVDVQHLMANWFSKKQDESLKNIDEAIGEERDVLMGQLKDQLNAEMQLAEKQLAEFTAAQKQTRIAALQEYANNLKAGMKVDNREQQAAIMANLDAIITQAKVQMEGQAAELKLIPIPTPEMPPTQAPVVPTPTPNPVLTPSPGSEGNVEQAPPVTEPNPETAPEPNQSTEPTTEEPAASTPEPVVVDIYSVNNWFTMPNLQNVTVEEIAIAGGVFSTESTFSDIMMNSKAREAMNSILSGIENHPEFHQIQNKSIDEMSRIAPSLFNEKVLYLLNKSLSQITI
ncbi:hypothetical protein [Psychrobacillus sp. OK032]|uniref:hypothetical protein n=1 Tax=Psychrobacillus sp. OK032 TaxID=1884358 RepID=UPI0008B3C939|nr:hypothetical protein [Psychrobacillus sp. OK032]SES30919.1 hypothetical protein SAMN05518872_107236 [Psychrobacillus sp. OK032]